MQSTINAIGVSLELASGRTLFENLSLSLSDITTGLVGPNGVGKTCLARLLAGDLEPTAGIIQRARSVALFPQREIPRDIPVEEYLGDDYEWSPLSGALLDPVRRDALCSELSGGQWMRVRLAKVPEDRFLILDEPTNDLDRDGREAVLRFLTARRFGTLLISHDRESLALCQEILELSRHGLARFGGDWETYVSARDREREALQRRLDVTKARREAAKRERSEKIERQEKRARRGAKLGPDMGLSRLLLGTRKRRAQVTTGKIDAVTSERTERALAEAYEAFSRVKVDPIMYAKLLGQGLPAQKLVAEARNFNVRFHDWIYSRDLTFTWRGNARVALRGANGSGKTTLLRAILGERLSSRGELRAGGLRTLYIDQRGSGLDESKSVLQNARDVSVGDESEIRGALAAFLFSGDDVFQKVSTLSGGERLRAALAKGFLNDVKPELLVLDEPTNNLDLVNIEFLENLVGRFPGAVIAVSHDETFLANCGIEGRLTL